MTVRETRSKYRLARRRRSWDQAQYVAGAVRYCPAMMLMAAVSTAGGVACRFDDGKSSPSPTVRVQGQDTAQGARTLVEGSRTSEPAFGIRGGRSDASRSGRTTAWTPRRRLVWDFPEAPLGELRVMVTIPPHDPKSAPLSVLVALHGKGEALKGPVRGARAWVDDYRLEEAAEALERGRPTVDDFHGFVTNERLASLRADLSSQAYRGMIVVMPYTPLALAGDKPSSAVLPYGRFLIQSVLPRVYRETPAASAPSSTGIDGVSLGGRIALLVGLSFPTAFGAVGTLQAAFDSSDSARLVELARSARRQNPALKLRLLTSDGDFYLEPLRAISEAWREAGIEHEFRVVLGPHDYEFNRGPGALEMLFFHDRVLRFDSRARPAESSTP